MPDFVSVLQVLTGVNLVLTVINIYIYRTNKKIYQKISDRVWRDFPDD